MYTALNQQCGWIGETSTEVGGAIDLHPDAPLPQQRYGDITNDGAIDVGDLSVLLNEILMERYSVACDLNKDYLLDVLDINLLINAILRQ